MTVELIDKDACFPRRSDPFVKDVPLCEIGAASLEKRGFETEIPLA